MSGKYNKQISAEQAFTKLANICAKQECCLFDIQNKLNKLGIDQEKCNVIKEMLVQQNFIDEQRYANTYSKDKFTFNTWGKTKIKYMLTQKRISIEHINNALHKIDEEQYYNALVNLIKTKHSKIKDKDDNYKTKSSLVRYASSRGFELDLIYKVIEEI